ncbi:MAG: hypothetical protein OXC95_17810 [Dehalococcoidia bacterium]|nr:hypothetical protein [Dehalococcoidia bacterium]
MVTLVDAQGHGRSSVIVHLHNLRGQRIKMIMCLEKEPDPPTDPLKLEEWCALGKSGRPIQTHIGDSGIVQRIVDEEVLVVQFDDGDERLLYVDEVNLLSHNACE